MSTHKPIEPRHHDLMNAVAGGLDEIFNGNEAPKKIAFVLLVAETGHIDNGRVNYISNGHRDDMVLMLKELLARFEGRHVEEQGGAPRSKQ